MHFLVTDFTTRVIVAYVHLNLPIQSISESQIWSGDLTGMARGQKALMMTMIFWRSTVESREMFTTWRNWKHLALGREEDLIFDRCTLKGDNLQQIWWDTSGKIVFFSKKCSIANPCVVVWKGYPHQGIMGLTGEFSQNCLGPFCVYTYKYTYIYIQYIYMCVCFKQNSLECKFKKEHFSFSPWQHWESTVQETGKPALVWKLFVTFEHVTCTTGCTKACNTHCANGVTSEGHQQELSRW